MTPDPSAPAPLRPAILLPRTAPGARPLRLAEGLLVGLASALALATALRLPAAWESGNALNHVSGAWMALAEDLARGTFYRPLHAPGGPFGGTRFFPLAFAAHAALLRLGGGLVASGYALSLAAGALLVLASFLLLRRLGLSRQLALAFSALAFSGFAGQLALADVRGDLLPVALSVLGLAVLSCGAPARRIGAAALLFALAFAAKPTALTAAAAATAWLALRGRRRTALALGSLVLALSTLVLVAIDALSSGRFPSMLGQLATGGLGARDALRAPVELAVQLAVADRGGVAVVAAALTACAAAAGGLLRGVRAGRARSPLLLPALWLGSALLGALAVFASPGTGVNHLVELEAASAVALGAATQVEGAAARVARLAAPAAALAGFALALATWRTDLSSSRLHEIRAIVRALPPGGPILSEDPLVPLLAGERPWVLDPWMLRIAAERSPAEVRTLDDDLRRRAFPAVVLFQDLGDPGAEGWYVRGNLGVPLVREIRAAYRRSAGFGRYHLYLPRVQTIGGGSSPDDVVARPPAR